MPTLSPIKRRILELSKQHDIGHLSSNLTTADVLDRVRGCVRENAASFKPHSDECSHNSILILSSGHAGLALYCYLEKYCGQSAAALLEKHGTQPHLDPANGIHCTTGSLGQGLTVAVGYAIANRKRPVHCIISDGECAEGCVWESLAFTRLHHLENLIVHVNINGYSALAAVDVAYLVARLKAFLPWIQLHFTDGNQLPFLRGLHAHYKTMTPEEYEALQLETN